jgi:hypothetical protein
VGGLGHLPLTHPSGRQLPAALDPALHSSPQRDPRKGQFGALRARPNKVPPPTTATAPSVPAPSAVFALSVSKSRSNVGALALPDSRRRSTAPRLGVGAGGVGVYRAALSGEPAPLAHATLEDEQPRPHGRTRRQTRGACACARKVPRRALVHARPPPAPPSERG